jgi:thioesterase domain-containing protein/acyl carrier protein
LPMPEDITSSVLAPRNDLELAIKDIWSQLLQNEKISIRDNFFEVGGHSLLAIQLIHNIRKKFDIELPIASIFTAPTIEAIAQLIEKQTQTSLHSQLVPIQSKGNQPTLFAIHPIGGNVLCYAELSHQLGSKQPFYGLEQMNVMADKLTIESMASQYIDAIRKQQPHGPYYLIGWSMGGIIAIEMAHQLEKQNESIAFIGLIDSYLPSQMMDLSKLDDVDLLIYFTQDLSGRSGINLTLTRKELIKLPPKQQLIYLFEKAKANGLLNQTANLTELETLFMQCKKNLLAIMQYYPNIVSAPIVLFSAKENINANITYSAAKNAKAWSTYTKGDFTKCDMKGNHYSLLSLPQVRQLAKNIKQFIKHYKRS